MKKGIYNYGFDFGYGTIEGLFLADEDDIRLLENNDISIYYGEVLGKHSEISVTVEPGDFKLITEDPKAIEIFEKYEMECGYNPLEQELCVYEMTIPDGVIPADINPHELTVQEYINLLRKLC